MSASPRWVRPLAWASLVVARRSRSAGIRAGRRRSWCKRFWLLPSLKRSCSTPCSSCASRTRGGPMEEIARTFGVNWPHLFAQIVSFGIVCAVLYAFAYKPVLQMLDTRRQQIASGLANAEKIRSELARIEAERRAVLTRADGEGKQLIEEARAAAARVHAEETRKAIAAAEQVAQRAR